MVHYCQVMLATKPDPLTGKSPSIVTDDNIQLLFEIQQKVLQISDIVLHALSAVLFWNDQNFCYDRLMNLL